MTAIPDHFPPNRAAALERLRRFAVGPAGDYARNRNIDFGPGAHDNVSQLSPYLRLRLLDERSVLREILRHHDSETANRYVTEVFWRGYWKGWLELRPAVWESYQKDVEALYGAVQTDTRLVRRWKSACEGRTGIAPFDAWAEELVQTGYLHNHARMWFASIWVFTLGLPWQLGADLFLRHLLDGDVASNTLNWRWVAGVQTKGKPYLATARNIAAFTDGRFPAVRGLASVAALVPAEEHPEPGHLPALEPLPRGGRTGVLLHADDVDPSPLLRTVPEPAAWGYADATAGHSPGAMAPHFAAFREACAADAAPDGARMEVLKTAEAIADWAARHGLTQVYAPYAPVGTTQQMISAYRAIRGTPPMFMHRRPLDSAAWPKATRGFFKFRKNIPEFLERFVLD
jgi:deoxyribodipyrimidine photo-lyase